MVELAEEGIAALRSLPDKGNEYPTILAQLLHLKGCSLCDQKRLVEAEKEIAESARLDPKQPVYEEDLERIRTALKERPREGAGPLSGERVGRNDSCPCGSGKKFKRCCGVSRSSSGVRRKRK